MIKTIKLGTGGMVKDMTKKEFPSKMFYDASNIRLVAISDQSTYAITNEFGNDLFFIFPTIDIDAANNKFINTAIEDESYFNELIYTTGSTEIEAQFTTPVGGLQKLIGQINSRNGIILFTTDGNGFDCIWELNTDGVINTPSNPILTLKYCRNMGFSTTKQIQAIYFLN